MLSPKITLLIILFISLVGCDNTPKPIADSRQNDYALYDASGGFHRFSRYNDSKGIVLFVQGNGCPIVRNALTDFNAIVEDFSEEGFVFFMINSNLQDSKKTIAKEANDFDFTVPVLLDNNQIIADELDITITAEILILHPTTRKILYRGPINNRLDYESQKVKPTETYLRDALNAIINKKQVVSRQEVVRGCRVTRLSKLEKNKAPLTYTKDIAPILIENCVQCHKEDGIAPWAMTDYQTVVGWSGMIKEVLLSRRMPPSKIDPNIGQFSNLIAMPDSSRHKIISWINNGLKPGEGADLLQAIKKVSKKDWQLGTPDKILEIEEEVIPATGLIPYREQTLKLDINGKKWIKALEVKPGNRNVVHHVILTKTSGKKSNPAVKRATYDWIDNFIVAVAGSDREPTIFPEDSGILVEEGDSLQIQIHYTTYGKIQKDKTKIGLYFHNEKPEKEYYTLSVFDHQIEILPFQKNKVEVKYDSIISDVNIHTLFPHMHYRGKSIKMYTEDKNGNKKILLSVPDYDFNWQKYYVLKKPILVKAGTKIYTEGIFDNSYQNPKNPDPSVTVVDGRNSVDEMLMGVYTFTLDDEIKKTDISN